MPDFLNYGILPKLKGLLHTPLAIDLFNRFGDNLFHTFFFHAVQAL
jgi:hypothetical protein